MSLQDLLSISENSFKKKNKEVDLKFNLAKDEKPTTGMIVDNPLLEFLLDRRYLAYGRFYLVYGKKGSAKTSFFYDFAKLFQKNKGDVIWLETENAADIDYAAKQGVDLSKLALIHPQSLEQSLNLSEDFIRNMPKAYPDGNTPVLICLDSIAGAALEYEIDPKHSISDTMPGTHARLLSRWYREMEGPLANEKCIFLALNQQKEKIGAFGFGSDADGPESLIGGNAPLFSSTYQFKFAQKGQILQADEYGMERKVGSEHIITCKRNKLGREGNAQQILIDLKINGGIDWNGSLARFIGKNYTSIIEKKGAWYRWKTPDTAITLDGQTGVINTEQSYNEENMGKIIAASPQAKELIRKVFGIPDLPPDSVIQEIEEERLTKRKKRKTLTDEDNGPKREP
jgi:recombination protein RecA